MSPAIRTVALAALIAGGTAAAQAETNGLAGAWSQKSSGKELVLVSKLKIQPAIGATGFVVGTLGSGAATTATTLNYELQPADVNRAMQLHIAADGTFRWIIFKDRAESAKKPECRIETRDDKRGTFAADGARLSFRIAEGRSAVHYSCNEGKDTATPLKASEEAYDFRIDGSRLLISGSGGVNWTFEPL